MNLSPSNAMTGTSRVSNRLLDHAMRQGPVNYNGLDNTCAKRKRRRVQNDEERKCTKAMYKSSSPDGGQVTELRRSVELNPNDRIINKSVPIAASSSERDQRIQRRVLDAPATLLAVADTPPRDGPPSGSSANLSGQAAELCSWKART